MRLSNLLSEINLMKTAVPHALPDRIISIPRGMILNWRYGLRKKIPINFTIRRWKSIISDAVRNDKVVHLYTHPHNFINGDQMFTLFENILRVVSEAQKRNDIINVTQKEYAERLLNIYRSVP